MGNPRVRVGELLLLLVFLMALPWLTSLGRELKSLETLVSLAKTVNVERVQSLTGGTLILLRVISTRGLKPPEVLQREQPLGNRRNKR